MELAMTKQRSTYNKGRFHYTKEKEEVKTMGPTVSRFITKAELGPLVIPLSNVLAEKMASNQNKEKGIK